MSQKRKRIVFYSVFIIFALTTVILLRAWKETNAQTVCVPNMNDCIVCLITHRKATGCPATGPALAGAGWTTTRVCHTSGEAVPESEFTSDGTGWCTMQTIEIQCPR